MVFKTKPDYLADRFNLIGGKIESNETIEAASLRELREESGFIPLGDPIIMGQITGSWGVVHCVKIPVAYGEANPAAGETEEFYWINWDEIRNTNLIQPNLNVIIPLMYSGVTGWVIEDEGQPTGYNQYSIKVILNNVK